jgi:tyrosyl-tRNA synthetase
MYGKVMSLPDNLIAPYYKLCTEIPLDTIDGLVKTLADGANPRDSKASLAREIVRIYHGEAVALKAEESWNATFRDKSGPSADMITTIKISAESLKLIDFLTNHQIRDSRSQVRTLVEQGGIKVNGEKVTDVFVEVKVGDQLSIGKTEFYDLVKR